MNIKGKIVTLRAIEQEDLELMREMLNDPEMENLVIGWSFPIAEYQQNLWYERNIDNEKNIRLIIDTSNYGTVGMATLTDIDWKNRKATHGIKIAKTNIRAKGIGTDTVMAIMKYAFDELQLNRLDCSWFELNKGSQKLYAKCGWKIEGVRRQYIYKRGSHRNLVIAGILREDYYRLIKENNYWNV